MGVNNKKFSRDDLLIYHVEPKIMYKAKKIDRYGEIWYRSDEDLG